MSLPELSGDQDVLSVKGGVAVHRTLDLYYS